jgi:hypothetical protein
MKARGAVEEQHGGSGVYECAAQRELSLLCLVARIMERDFFSIENAKEIPETEFFIFT